MMRENAFEKGLLDVDVEERKRIDEDGGSARYMKAPQKSHASHKNEAYGRNVFLDVSEL